MEKMEVVKGVSIMIIKFIESIIATIIIIYMYQKLESWNFCINPFYNLWYSTNYEILVFIKK